MKFRAVVAAALAVFAIGVAPLAAQAQEAEAPKITKAQRDRGTKEAPAAMQAAGQPCTITDAYFMGNATQKDEAGKDVKSNIYEVSCKEGLGYVVMSTPTSSKAYDCLVASGNKSIACRLPANANPKQAIAAMAVAAGRPCTVKDARYVGASSSGSTVYEVACQEGGYIIQARAGGTPQAIPCIDELDSNLECKLTSRADVLAGVSQLAAKSGKPCTVSNARTMGTDPKTGQIFYEVACGSAAGFVIQTDKNGTFMTAVDCGKAQAIGGGCRLTDTTVAETADATNYSRLAKAAGFDCNVSKYRFIGTVDQPKKSELVELACSNRPEGTVAMFPADNSKGTLIDCVQAGQFGPTAACELSKPTAIYAKYTDELKAKGKTTCAVSGARYIGRTADNMSFIETACADGNPGWVLELSQANTVASVMNCAQAASAGLACKLPTNQVAKR